MYIHIVGRKTGGVKPPRTRFVAQAVTGYDGSSKSPRAIRAAMSPWSAWVGGGDHLTDTTHVDNVVEGLLLTAANGRAGEAYFVTDGDRVVFREFVSAMLRTQGVEPPTRTTSPPW